LSLHNTIYLKENLKAMSKEILFITGGSRGIGAALARAWAGPDTEMHLYSRTKNSDLDEELSNMGVTIEWHSLDLSKTEQAVDYFRNQLGQILWDDISSAWLFNNAGMLEPIGKVGKKDVTTLLSHLSLNVSTPLAWSHLFTGELQDKDFEKWVVNIGSGAANHPYYGWAPYGSGKAALHHFTETMGLEQEEEKFPVNVFAFNPGRTDTDMQSVIRETDKEDFLHVESFVEAYEKGELNDPGDLAKRLQRWCEKGDFSQGQIVTHREI